MTLGIAWVRKIKNTTELVIASDSRLSGGETWDGNPKIMILPRKDSAISFAGSTFDAYPLMIHACNAVGMYDSSLKRKMDLCILKGHLLRTFNDAIASKTDFPIGLPVERTDAMFLLAGFSWRFLEFKIWTLFYDPSISRFTFRPSRDWGGQSAGTKKRIAFVGDPIPVAEAKKRLLKLLKSKNKLQSGHFDMEPFAVLRDLLRESKFRSIGGAPQVVKIYPNSNSAPFGVRWPDASGNIHYFGRPLLDYEQLHWGEIDPDNPIHGIEEE